MFIRYCFKAGDEPASLSSSGLRLIFILLNVNIKLEIFYVVVIFPFELNDTPRTIYNNDNYN